MSTDSKLDIDKLIQNVIDQIKEAQLKLGFEKEVIRLYFPVASLNALLGTDYGNGRQMLAALQGEQRLQETVLGPLEFSLHKGRIEIRIAPEGAAYVHMHVPEPAFLKRLIGLFAGQHHLTIEAICECFAEFSEAYSCEQMRPEDDFDYALHFTDERIDTYYYCIKMEMGHTIYHRFTPEDYQLLLANYCESY